jgi:hypothetical protein
MMSEASYNGWKNYPTWAVNLWLGNERVFYEECCYMAREALRDAPHDENANRRPWLSKPGEWLPPIWTLEETARFRLADTMKEYVTDLIHGDDESAGLGNDLIGYALGEVDWNEIADSWLESAKEEESYA